MIVVRIEVWPHGSPQRARLLRVLTIANVRGDVAVADYDYAISAELDDEGDTQAVTWKGVLALARDGIGALKRGRLEGFRRREGALQLLASVLQSAGL